MQFPGAIGNLRSGQRLRRNQTGHPRQRQDRGCGPIIRIT
jgi:hypothetical protein